MKPLNNKEITTTYLSFLGYFSLLLLATMLCIHLFHKTSEAYTKSLMKRKSHNDLLLAKKAELSFKIDSLNGMMKMLNTAQVKNEAALERAILKVKKEAIADLDFLETDGIVSYPLHRKIIQGVEFTLDLKKGVDQAMKAEGSQRKKLFECIDANSKAQKALITPTAK